MADYSLFYVYPLWVNTLVIFVILVIALEAGVRTGIRHRKIWADGESGGGGVVLSALLALMGLILAFTYSSSVSRFDARKQSVVMEANALGTAYLRADLVAEPGRSELKQALLSYARTRVVSQKGLLSAQERRQFIANSLEAQAILWPLTVGIVTAGKPGPIEVSLASAINEVLDVHTERIAALVDKLPSVVVWMLVLIGASSMAVVGYNAAISGPVSRWRMMTFALVLTGIMLIIIDFDRPGDGLIRVNTVSIENTIADMEAEFQR